METKKTLLSKYERRLLVTKVKVLVLEEGRPARVENLPAAVSTFRELVQGEPIMVPFVKNYSIIVERNSKRKNNIHIMEAGQSDFGMLKGTCIAVSNTPTGELTSLDDKDICVLRGFLESRRVGSA